MKPKVFLVNEPLRKNDTNGDYEKFLPIEKAGDHGDVVRLTPDGSPPGNPASWLRMIDEGLANWKDGDFVVLVGDQGLLAYASAAIGARIEFLTAKSKGEDQPVFRALKWSRHNSRYDPLSLGFSTATPARESAKA